MSYSEFEAAFEPIKQRNIKRNMPHLNHFDFLTYRFPHLKQDLTKKAYALYASDFSQESVKEFTSTYSQLCELVYAGYVALCKEWIELGERSRKEMERVTLQREFAKKDSFQKEQPKGRGKQAHRKGVQHSKRSIQPGQGSIC